MAAGLLLLTRVEPGDGYVARVLPGVALFGLGLTLFGAQLTGITSEELFDPAQMTDGFHIAMAACAALATIGGVPAWHKISRDARPARCRGTWSVFLVRWSAGDAQGSARR